MRIRHLLQAAALASTLAISGAAFAEDAHTFLESEQQKIASLLRQPASGDRDAKIQRELSVVLDYAEMTRKAFGAHWDDTEVMTDARKALDALPKLF